MTTETKQLITSFILKKIDTQSFLDNYFANKTMSDEYIIKLLHKGINEKDPMKIEEAIVLVSTGRFDIYNFQAVFCQLLLLDWHYKHEDIAMYLKEIGDPSTVECLYLAAENNLQYLEYDQSFQFARKCIKALSAIGNEAAVQKLKILSESKVLKIAEYAKKELNHKGLN